MKLGLANCNQIHIEIFFLFYFESRYNFRQKFPTEHNDRFRFVSFLTELQ